MDEEKKPVLGVQREWVIKADGSRGRVVRRLREGEVQGEAHVDPPLILSLLGSAESEFPPDIRVLQNAVFHDDPYVERSGKEALVFNTLYWKPIEVEEGVRRVLGLDCWLPNGDDDKALADPGWPWHVACSWIAAQTNVGAAANIAAHRHWGGRTIRDGCRPGQVMSFAEASIALRRALERGEVHGRKDDGVGAEEIPTLEWIRLEWETIEGETREFVRLLRDGTPAYRNPVVIAAEVQARDWDKEGSALRSGIHAASEHKSATADASTAVRSSGRRGRPPGTGKQNLDQPYVDAAKILIKDKKVSSRTKAVEQAFGKSMKDAEADVTRIRNRLSEQLEKEGKGE